MVPSRFNLRVPLAGSEDVFLMNTLTDAQLVVSREVADVLDRVVAEGPFEGEEAEVLAELESHGFVMADRAAEEALLERHFHAIRTGTQELRVTLLTTLQCNFACSYCYQGDHGDHNKFAQKMTLETARQVERWIESRLDELSPERLVLTFFGGEPLLNLPVMYQLSERLWAACQGRGIDLRLTMITNGLLLTPEVVDRLLPYGLYGIKVTLDGDRSTHDQYRPLRGGQGTFDRIIENIRQVADRCAISIGGNFDEASVESYPALLDFLRQQEFADKLVKISFKPIIQATPQTPKGMIPLRAVGGNDKPLGGTCMTSAGAGRLSSSSPCDTCHFVDEKMAFLRRQTKRHGFPTIDGVHMGPCELHKQHAYTIGPEGSLYPCPGFTGDLGQSVGHVDGRADAARERVAREFDRLAPWKACGDCSFIPVCGGGCSVASHTELGDMHSPSCHKASFETALVDLAAQAAATL